MFPLDVTEEIRDHAIAEYPNESVGAVIRDKAGVISYRPLVNIHPEPTEAFKVDGRAIAGLKRNNEILGIVHSHPNGPFFPSRNDMETQLEWGIPFGITVAYGTSASRPMWWGGNAPRPPLYGRQFVHGTQDCFSFIRDYFKEEHNIEIPDFARDDEWWLNKENNPNLYLNHFKDAGFVRISQDELQPGDCIMMRIRSEVPNHGAVYLGGDEIGHHLAMRLSCKETGFYRWERHFHSFYRHERMFK